MAQHMKFIASSTGLLKQLQLISGVINSNNTMPILDNFLFDLQNQDLRLVASDLETVMSAKMQVESTDSGKAAVPARLLLDTLKTFPEQPLTFVFDTTSQQIELSSDYGKYNIPFLPGEEFPTASELESPSTTTIPAELLATSIGKSLFATGNDELRPVMSGVFFQFSPEHLRFVSTDAHKLVRYTRNDARSEGSAEFIMPKKPLNLLKATLGVAQGDVVIKYNEANCHFVFDHVELTCRLIDGKYPNYEAVIPQNNPNTLTVNRIGFLSSIKRVNIYSNKSTHQVRLKISGNELQISAEDVDSATRADERITCQYSGSDMEIGFNSRFLVDMLNNLESDDIQMKLSDPNRAGLLFPADGLEEGEDILMLVMPVMINH